MKRIFGRSLALLMFLILIGFSFAVLAAEKGDKDEKDEKKPVKIEAVIHGTGVIDRISSKEVVLGDQMFNLAPNVSIKLAEDGSSYSGTLKKGMLIGIEQNKDKEIVTIWVLKQGK